ncbi:MAG: M20/M25/M40 family metallo-hydrolase, partial [Pseudomonadota bacterium]
MQQLEPISLTQDLIRCPSVTPAEGGALDLLERVLSDLGFDVSRVLFEAPDTPPVENLYERLGTLGPNFCFAGHTDVVPVGRRERWSRDPFAATIEDGVLLGRGAADMKGAIAAFICAAQDYLVAPTDTPTTGSISLLITGDEEGPAINDTRKMLDWLKGRGQTIDHCLVGE